jgi:hypothetical protein
MGYGFVYVYYFSLDYIIACSYRIKDHFSGHKLPWFIKDYFFQKHSTAYALRIVKSRCKALIRF